MWQPIETAPKDGSWVLVFDPSNIDESYEVRPVSAQWTEDMNGGKTDWHWQFAWFDGGYFGDCEPTHWMPLPEPPQSLSASDSALV